MVKSAGPASSIHSAGRRADGRRPARPERNRMWQRLCELLQRSQDSHILVVGDFMIDRYLYGDAERISPEAPVPVLRVIREEDTLGGAGSVAADIAALGAVPHCVGVVGRGDDADRLAAMLSSAGAKAGALVADDGRRTTLKTRLVGLAQHRHRQQLIRVDDETTDPLDEATADRLLVEIERLLATCQVVCLEDYNKGVITPYLAGRVCEVARKRGVPVLVDPANIADYTRYIGGTLITPNRTETERVTGLRLRDVATVADHKADILAACHTDYVCVTLDADGAALIGPGGHFEHVPTKKRDVYDVTGAGDEVLAALAVTIAAGGDYREAVHVANVAGGLEVEKFGCVPITRDEVLGEIILEHHRAAGKIRSLEQLVPELTRRRGCGEKVVFTNGCFDLVHAGHAATFAFCKEHGDLLVVGLNSDDSVRSLGKAPGRPIIGQDDRAAMLAAMSDVDYIVTFNEQTPQALIEAIKPDTLVKGRDWEGKTVVGRDIVEAAGGKVLFVPLVEGLSTTQIIDRIRRM